MQNECSLRGNVSLTSVSENDSEAEDVEAAAETPGQAVENVQPEGSAQAAENATQETIEQEVSDPIQPTQSEAEERVYEGTDISSYVTVKDGIITSYTGEFTDIVIPQSIDGTVITGIGQNVFANHSELLSVQFPEGLVSIGNNAFQKCTNLGVPVLPESLRSIGGGAFEETKMGTKNKTGELVIPVGLDELGKAAFKGCSELEKVTFMDYTGEGSPEEIKFTQIWGAGATFSECPKLKEIYLSNRVKVLPGEFALNDTALTTVNWPQGLTSINADAFSGCTVLENCDFSGTQLEVIGTNAFRNCMFGLKRA